VGWRIKGSSTCLLAADRGEKCRAIYVCISFLRAVVVVLVVSIIILIHFVVVIFSLRMHAQQVFSVLFTGVLNTIACICRRGVSGGFPAGLRLAFVSSVRDSFGHGKCHPIFYRGLMCMCCVCVYAHAHTLHVVYSDVCPGVGTRHLESPEEIQMYCSDSIHIYRAVYKVHMYIYIRWAEGRSLD